MTQAQRQAAATKFGRIVWDGAEVNGGIPNVLSFGSREVRILTPASIAGAYQFGTAAFGAPLSSPGITGQVVDAQDDANAQGPTTTDACTPLTNAAAVAGKIALVERGMCSFARKARTVEDAGAIGIIIYNNLANVNAAPAGMAGDPTVIPPPSITAVSLTRADGLAVLGQVPSGTTAKLSVDFSIRAGADAAGRARMYAPFPVAPGSSISHYDPVAFRNLLMEPAISGDLTHNVKAPYDLTLELLRDVGWFPDADLDGVADGVDCNPNSDLSPTVVIDGCVSGVPNTLFTTGCTISDLITQIAANSRNHGQFVSSIAHLTNELKKAGLITGDQTGAIRRCAARASVP
ncbi:MAG: hypothetical protein M3410_02350 [Acidobacteriota bacterium]|nr:hypothetical protein [Acidobacteriota bacterium]